MEHNSVNIAKYGFSILQIETESVCNMACGFCPYPARENKGKILPTGKVKEIIDSLVMDNSFKYLCLSHFNEPLLDERIYEFIHYAKERKIPVMLITNGLLFNSEDVIHKLVKAAPNFIKLSAQTLNADLFKYSRGCNKSFLDYKNGIFRFLKIINGNSSKVTIDVACNFLSGRRGLITGILGLERGDPSVYAEVKDLKEDSKIFLKELGDTYECFSFDETGFNKYLNTINSGYLEQSGYRVSNNIDLKIKLFIHGKRLTEFHPIKVGVTCSGNILGVLATGYVVPCCVVCDDLTAMGNVRDESLKNILEKSQTWIKGIKTGKNLPFFCRRCLGAPTRRGSWFRQAGHWCYSKLR
ncbi:MAG: radical SAM protein [Candidatus Omnitrophota bacterium]